MGVAHPVRLPRPGNGQVVGFQLERRPIDAESESPAFVADTSYSNHTRRAPGSTTSFGNDRRPVW